MCVSCRDTDQFIISNSQVIKLIGGCTDCPLLDTVYKWSVTRMDGVNVPINLATTTTGGDRRNLVVRSSVIEVGYAYRFDKLVLTFLRVVCLHHRLYRLNHVLAKLRHDK